MFVLPGCHAPGLEWTGLGWACRQRKRQYSSNSSGFLVREAGQNWLLTNAHSVDYHTQVGRPGRCAQGLGPVRFA